MKRTSFRSIAGIAAAFVVASLGGLASASHLTIDRVSVDSSGNESNSQSQYPEINDNGRFVVFYAFASNLVPGDTNGVFDIFVHDRQGGGTERMSVNSVGVEGNADSFYPDISDDGRFVVFESNASNLVPGDTNHRSDVFVRDRLTGTTQRANVDSTGAEAEFGGRRASISGDGRFVAFSSASG